MNIDKILEYQTKDFEIYKLEKDLFEGEDKKIINAMVNRVKDAQNRSMQLEKKAAELNLEFEKLKKSFDINIENINKMQKTSFEKLSSEDLESYEKTLGDLVANLNLIDGKLSYFAKAINGILTDFEKAKKAYGNARQEYATHKEKYDEIEKKVQPEIEKANKELVSLEKGVDKQLLEKYKLKRQDKKFPIIVPLQNKTCGGCQMELSYSSLNKLKENDIIECEHCRRIIYSN